MIPGAIGYNVALSNTGTHHDALVKFSAEGTRLVLSIEGAGLKEKISGEITPDAAHGLSKALADGCQYATSNTGRTITFVFHTTKPGHTMGGMVRVHFADGGLEYYWLDSFVGVVHDLGRIFRDSLVRSLGCEYTLSDHEVQRLKNQGFEPGLGQKAWEELGGQRY